LKLPAARIHIALGSREPIICEADEMVLKRVAVVGFLLAAIAAAAFGLQISPPAVDPNLAEIAGSWAEVRTKKHLLLWPDGHYGPRNEYSGAGWRLVRPGHIKLMFCFSTRELEFHFEGQELVVEDGDDAGRYRRMSALLNVLARVGVDFD
jgi:hypothetical protein